MTSKVIDRQSRRGRPPTPLDPSASCAARLGAELRARREAENLTLQALSERIDYSAQHISQVERGRAIVTESFVRACDTELGTDGALMRLLPDVILEHAKVRSARVAARHGADTHSELNNEGRGVLVSPTAAREIDPTLPDHWDGLLAIFGAHDAAHGAQQLLGTARRELRLITEYRQVARGELRIAFMHVEARWSVYAGWLCEDTGDQLGRTALLERTLHLAREADHPDLIGWVRARQAQWSDPSRAIRLAEIGVHTPRASAHTRALCAVRAAHAHANIGDTETTKRLLCEANRLAAEDSAPPPLATSAPFAEHVLRRWEARCWALLQPAKGVALYDELLRDWPRGQTRDAGLYLARLARACADAGELDRARTEARKALAIAQRTRSIVATRELRQLATALGAGTP
jgi:transcriptional regulator with XRE-family HTH domain